MANGEPVRVRCIVAGDEIQTDRGTALFVYLNTLGWRKKVEGGIATVRFDGWERDSRIPDSHLEKCTGEHPE